MDAHLPLIGRTTAEAVAKTVGVACDPSMQDWPLEVADADRIEEFLSHYGRERNPEHRIAIAALIVASLDDAFALGAPSPQLLDRAGPILKNYPEMVEYWSCPDAHTDDEMFHITPWIRGL
jgi:hypothetical protein